MPNYYKNRVLLDKAITSKIIDAMNETYERLINKLLEYIKKDVYDTYEPQFYERTEDLLRRENWEEEIKKGNKYATMSIYFNGEVYSNYEQSENARDNPKAFIHGNYLYGQFNQDDFIKMLNGRTQYGDNPFNFPEISRRPFWDDFINYCEKYYPILFKNACKRNGIDIK